METESGGGVSSSEEGGWEEDWPKKEFLCAITRSESRESPLSGSDAQRKAAGVGAAPVAAPRLARTFTAANESDDAT